MQEFTNEDYDRVWSDFESKFAFRPSVKPEHWPGIIEPCPSYTISFASCGAVDSYPGHDPLADLFQDSFRRLTGNARIRYILDWQHTCYFASDEFKNTRVFPDGDYAICLNEAMDCGTFGHPWEKTLCVFGQSLIEMTRNRLPETFSTVVREQY